ncbi:MAG: hypothetical protein IBX50_20385 [Marinospirillum sp.]|uniref:hypothetical protein n=1 Tax=Marinospirillum sp. TaxID=2183934 RepID=UPI0019EB0D2E|nr:hypothetical protein [Marinospirillum sp.]MBE0509043.1 hypothetical protein [Marinospirillum sp.]
MISDITIHMKRDSGTVVQTLSNPAIEHDWTVIGISNPAAGSICSVSIHFEDHEHYRQWAASLPNVERNLMTQDDCNQKVEKAVKAARIAWMRQAKPDTYKRLAEWFISGDVGASSRAIAATLTGSDSTYPLYHPADSSDFGRCHKLLKVVPEFRARITEMAGLSEQWAALVRRWDDLEAAYEEDPRKCWSMMCEILYK